jgi:hypothetical protein
MVSTKIASEMRSCIRATITRAALLYNNSMVKVRLLALSRSYSLSVLVFLRRIPPQWNDTSS